VSEHRSKHAANVIRFPRREDEDWPPEIISKWTERAKHVRAYVESGALPIDALLWVQREGLGMLTLYWAGKAPRKADKLVKQLAPKWAELMKLMASNKEKAEAMLAKQRRIGNG
jgi:hypothetical protein